MKIEASKETTVEVLDISHQGCKVKLVRRLNGEVVGEQVRTLTPGDIVQMRLSTIFTYEIDFGLDDELH